MVLWQHFAFSSWKTSASGSPGTSTLLNYFKPLQYPSSPFMLHLPFPPQSSPSNSLSPLSKHLLFIGSPRLYRSFPMWGKRRGVPSWGLLSFTDHLPKGLGGGRLSLRQSHTGQHHDNGANVCKGDERWRWVVPAELRPSHRLKVREAHKTKVEGESRKARCKLPCCLRLASCIEQTVYCRFLIKFISEYVGKYITIV